MNKGVPIEGDVPPMEFEDIDRACMLQLVDLDRRAQLSNMDPVSYLAQTNSILLGTLKEIMHKLASLHPKKVEILNG